MKIYYVDEDLDLLHVGLESKIEQIRNNNNSNNNNKNRFWPNTERSF